MADVFAWKREKDSMPIAVYARPHVFTIDGREYAMVRSGAAPKGDEIGAKYLDLSAGNALRIASFLPVDWLPVAIPQGGYTYLCDGKLYKLSRGRADDAFPARVAVNGRIVRLKKVY